MNASPSAHAQAPPPPISVFLVEDLKPMRGAMLELLASLGNFRLAGEAATEAEARLWLDEHPGAWQLAVIDLVLEQGTGMGVISRCRATAPQSKVVVFSEYATPGIRAHCMNLGADAVFQKSQELGALANFCAGLAGNTD